MVGWIVVGSTVGLLVDGLMDGGTVENLLVGIPVVGEVVGILVEGFKVGGLEG